MKRIRMPPFSKHPFRKWVVIFFTGFASILFLGAGFFSHYASRRIEGRLNSIGAHVGSIDVNIFTRQISISSFDLGSPSDSSHGDDIQARLKNIVLEKISLYDLVVHKKVQINEILIADGTVRFNRKKKSGNHQPSSAEISIKKIFVDRLVLRNVDTTIANDSLILCSGNLNLIVNNVQSSDTSTVDDLNAYTIKDLESKIINLQFNTPNGFYQVKIAAVQVSSRNQQLQIDSLILVPKYPKYKFSRVADKQIDRINAFIPRIEITGLQYDHLRDSTFLGSKIKIFSAELLSFRDKRMPFKEKKNKPLPIAAIKQFDIGLEIDTIQIKDSKITYEEFPPDGFKSGEVVFENLEATLVNLSNKTVYQNKSRFATLEASAKIMGKGLIQATFSLPLDNDKQYHAKGKISQMSLHHLNPALENLAFIRVESGMLNNLNFDFDYNDRSSKGTLTINYEDLKITGLKKEKSPDESDIKTLLINTIVKNDKDKNMPIDKRTGAIEFERDRKRQIFNFWWKSLLSGIKGSVLNAEKDSRKSKGSKK